MTCGIYKLTAANGAFYIGSSKDIEGRWKTHRREFRQNAHHSRYAQRAYNKYGALTEEILLLCEIKDLLLYEQICIDSLNPTLNASKIAGRVECTPEVRKILSEKAMGNKRCLGVFPSAETKAKISAANKGQIITPEARAKMSVAAKNRSPESRAGQIAYARSREPMSQETRSKIGLAMRNRIISEETKEKHRILAKRQWEEGKLSPANFRKPKESK